jgi:hypothetical protein
MEMATSTSSALRTTTTRYTGGRTPAEPLSPLLTITSGTSAMGQTLFTRETQVALVYLGNAELLFRMHRRMDTTIPRAGAKAIAEDKT